MTAVCDAAIHLCRIRVTRLDDLGNPEAGPNNVYVSDNPLMLGVKPVYLAGEDKDLVGGCDCLVATYRGFDKFKRFDLELDLSKLEFGLLEMLIGADAILDGSDPIGAWWPDVASCSTASQPNVAFEGWQDAWDDDHQDPTWPYVHWLWTSSFWALADTSLGNDFTQPKVTAFTRGNPNWGAGIYGDQPEAAGNNGGAWYTDEVLPTAQCGYQSHAIT